VSGGFIEKLAGPLKATPYRIAITGHVGLEDAVAGRSTALEPSADRANVIRRDPRSGGMPSAVYAVPAGPTPIRCCLTTRSLPPIAARPSP
jgi:hypothetical protein